MLDFVILALFSFWILIFWGDIAALASDETPLVGWFRGMQVNGKDRDTKTKGINLDKYFRSGDKDRRFMDVDKNLKALKCLSTPSEQTKGISGKGKTHYKFRFKWMDTLYQKSKDMHSAVEVTDSACETTTDAISWTVVKPTTKLWLICTSRKDQHSWSPTAVVATRLTLTTEWSRGETYWWTTSKWPNMIASLDIPMDLLQSANMPTTGPKIFSVGKWTCTGTNLQLHWPTLWWIVIKRRRLCVTKMWSRYFGQQKLWEEQMQDEYSLTSIHGGGTKKFNWWLRKRSWHSTPYNSVSPWNDIDH